MIDLRSDTVTQPTAAMREAMAAAIVGDDVYGEDPTVNELERLAAVMLGKQKALFVPSGTMGNQVSIMTHVSRGGEIICGEQAHIVQHEVGAAAALSSAHMREIAFVDSMADEKSIALRIRDKGNIHYPPTQLIEIENPTAMGRVVKLETMKAIRALATEKSIPVHLDGARLFYAAYALGVDAKEIAACADSVMTCLSKGLCAPVGSIVAGDEEFIERARKNRKILGGGMRQAGILAAAGIIGLKEMTKRVGEDCENAKYMANKLKDMERIEIDLSSVDINLVFFKIDMPRGFKDALEGMMLERGVKICGEEDGYFRFVTSNDVSRNDVDTALNALADCIKKGA